MKLGKSLLAAHRSRLIQSCPICSSLDGEALAPIAAMAGERVFEKGALLMQEGDLCTGFFLVISGKVRVFKAAPSGREKVLLMAEPGTTFGEDALFGSGVFLQNAMAVEQTRALHVPRTEFLNMLRKNGDLAFQVMESLCLWIRRLSTSVENVAFLTARDKVGRYLLDLWNQAGGGTSATLPAKKKEVADRLGIMPETLSRVLREFQERRIIRIEKRTVRFTDIAQLQELASQ